MKETYKEFWNQETIKNYRNLMKNSKAWMNLGKEVGKIHYKCFHQAYSILLYIKMQTFL